MQLALIAVLVLGLMMSADEPSAVTTSLTTWLLLAGGLALAPAAAVCGSAWVVRGIRRDFPDCRDWMLRFERVQGIVLSAWLGAAALIYLVGRWPHIVRGNWQLQRWPLADDLVILAPPLIALLAVWTVYWRVERTLRGQTGEELPAAWPAWREFLGLHVRQHLGLPLVPVLLVLFAQDVTAWVAPRWLEQGSDYPAAIGSVGLLVILPFLLRWIWRTHTLPAGELREQLQGVCQTHACRVRDILIWNTGNRLPNAAITGFVPRLRYLLLSDALLAYLNTDELVAVVRHEATHVRRRHLLFRLLLVAVPVWMAICFGRQIPAWQEAWLTTGEAWGVARFWQQYLLWPGVAAWYVFGATGVYSRWLEFDADLGVLDELPAEATAAERLARVAPFVSALCRISGSMTRGSWLHPAVFDRVAFLRRASREPQVALQFRRRLWWGNGALVAMYAIVAAAGWLWR
jgi:STE24 endopeptidase